MAGPATAVSTSSAMPTSRAVSAPPRPAVRIPASCCPPCTGSRPWSSDGCWARIRARSRTRTCKATWTSSSSGSTGAIPEPAACSSTASSNLPSPTRQCATASWSPTRNPSPFHPGHREEEATRRAWNGPAQSTHGAEPPAHRSGQLNSPNAGIDKLGYTHEPRSQRAARGRGEDPGELLPGVHRVASLAKRWLLGTHQGSVDEAHLQSYLDEFTFRFNRRRSSSRGMVFYRVLQLAVGHTPVRYRDLVVDSRSKKIKPVPPGGGGNPPSLDRPRAARPWRATDLQ